VERRIGGPGRVWRRQGHTTGVGGRRSALRGSTREAGDEGGGGSGQGGSRLGYCHGPTQAHSADFDLKRIFKLNTI
jgi:hypothetical protein